MANTNDTFGQTASQEGTSWTNINNILNDNDTWAKTSFDGNNYDWVSDYAKCNLSSPKINNSGGNYNPSNIEFSSNFGGSSDLWGLNLMPSDVNNPNFFIEFCPYSNNEYFFIGKIGKSIIASNFGFNISTNATINGVLVETKLKWNNFSNTIYIYLRYIKTTIYYTESDGPKSVTGFGSIKGIQSIIL